LKSINLNTKISIIIPCHNEEGNIKLLYSLIKEHLSSYNIEYVFIDDKSNDQTLQIIQQLSLIDQSVKYISFSKNFGHQYALRAGLEYATGDCVISMDADLQHPVDLLLTLIENWRNGYDIVYTIRKDDENTNFLKKITASFFYKLINKLSEIEIKQGSADFRLIDRKIVDVLVKDITEYQLFYRGLISWIGFNKIAVEYTPNKRHTGTTKYSFWKMLNFAINGITSFSIKPLRFAILLGVIISLCSGIYAIYALFMGVFTDKTTTGWASVIISVLFIGGANMILLGIIGEYLGKIYIQNKKRPYFLIEKTNFTT